MAATAQSDLSARQKVAIIVMSLGNEAETLLRELKGIEVEMIAEEILKIGDIRAEVRDRVLTEFHNHIAATQARVEGGFERATEILEATLGKAKAAEAMQRMEWKSNERLVEFVRSDPEAFALGMTDEHPQTAAFLLTQVDAETSAQVMENLSDDIRSNLALRIATMREISPDYAAMIHHTVGQSMTADEGEGRKESVGGEDKVADLLNMVGIEEQKSVLDSIEGVDPEIAKRVRKLMFVFRDILLIDDRSMQRILKDIDQKDLGYALKTSDPDMLDKFFRNMSERAAETIKEEMEYMSDLKDEEVEEARDRIIDSIRLLEEQGEVVIDRSKGR